MCVSGDIAGGGEMWEWEEREGETGRRRQIDTMGGQGEREKVEKKIEQEEKRTKRSQQ